MRTGICVAPAELVGRMGWGLNPVSLYRFHTRQMTQDKDRMTTATFAVLERLYSAPDLPDEWLALERPGYSSAYIRALFRLIVWVKPRRARCLLISGAAGCLIVR